MKTLHLGQKFKKVLGIHRSVIKWISTANHHLKHLNDSFFVFFVVVFFSISKITLIQILDSVKLKLS